MKTLKTISLALSGLFLGGFITSAGICLIVAWHGNSLEAMGYLLCGFLSIMLSGGSLMLADATDSIIERRRWEQ